MVSTHTTTYLDTSKTKQTRLLALQPLVDLIGAIAVDICFLHQRERDTMVAFTEGGDFTVVSGLLSTELHNTTGQIIKRRVKRLEEGGTNLVAREAQNNEILVLVLVVELLETYDDVSNIES